MNYEKMHGNLLKRELKLLAFQLFVWNMDLGNCENYG